MPPTKPRRGRPAFADPSQVRSVVRTIKLTPAERESWQALADRQGITFAKLVREAVELAIVRGASR
jgi:hypothetical protein